MSKLQHWFVHFHCCCLCLYIVDYFGPTCLCAPDLPGYTITRAQCQLAEKCKAVAIWIDSHSSLGADKWDLMGTIFQKSYSRGCTTGGLLIGEVTRASQNEILNQNRTIKFLFFVKFNNKQNMKSCARWMSSHNVYELNGGSFLSFNDTQKLLQFVIVCFLIQALLLGVFLLSWQPRP